MKNVFFAFSAILALALGACKNDTSKSSAAGSDTPPVALFDSVAHAKQMEQRRKEAEANVITPDNIEQKGRPGAIAVGAVENTEFEKNDDLVSAAIAFLGGKSIAVTQDNGAYGYSLVDMNGDGVKDALLYLSGSNFCDGDKCTVLVAKGESGGKFKVHSMIRYLGLPVLVSETSQTKGWRDIIAPTFDSTGAATSVKLAFDGAKYPDSPTAAGVKPAEKAVKVSGYLMNAANTGLNLAN